MFTFKHTHKLLKAITYMAEITDKGVTVSWFQGDEYHVTEYTHTEADAAILSGDWVIQ